MNKLQSYGREKRWARCNNDGVVIPEVGDRVTYVSERNDGVNSPAVVLRTQATTNVELMKAWVEGNPDSLSAVKTAPEGVVVELPDNLTVDLLVHGLGGDYRRYTVSFSGDGEGGHWHWPVSESGYESHLLPR